MNQSHQSHHSRTGLTSHIFYACDAFSYLYVSFFYVLSLTKKNLTNQMVADPGLILLSILEFLHFDVEIGSDRIISIRVVISSIVSRSSIFIFCLSFQVILSRVSISFIFSRSL